MCMANNFYVVISKTHQADQMKKNSSPMYTIEFTQRTTRVLRAIDTESGRLKIDIKDSTTPFDTMIVDAWAVIEDGVLWLEYETGSSQTVKVRLATALRWSRQPKW